MTEPRGLFQGLTATAEIEQAKRTPKGKAKERDATAERIGAHLEAWRTGAVEGFAWCIVLAWKAKGYKAAKAMASEAVRRFGADTLARELKLRHFDPTNVIP